MLRLFEHLTKTGAKRSGANRRTSPATGSGLETRRLRTPPRPLMPPPPPLASTPRSSLLYYKLLWGT